uniref:FYVE-type domain-containing protein n=1 Tax=Globisporangium ultimum (strain ATCC 200006 / CBS 805.95 / DAOM BR144) TaxID=431595 RepID=K3WF94_GLOUD
MFPPLTLSHEQRAQFSELAQQLLESTLHEYEQLSERSLYHPAAFSSNKRWKAVKRRENLTVYREREPTPISLGVAVDKHWKDPTLLVAVGSIVGQLNDVMYGVATPDAASMLLKATITKNRLVGGAVLAQVEGPTIEEPFRFLGIKWFVIAPSTTLNGMIWPRDLVFVESTGITTLPNGDRIGHQLMRSVTIPGYGHLEEHSITRGRISSCSIFKQLPNGTVDVFVRGYVEAFGKVMETVALKTAASGFLSSWNAVGCAQYKKVMWCVQQQQRQSRHGNPKGIQQVPRKPVNEDPFACGACHKRFRAFHSSNMCILCDMLVCSRCRVLWKLWEVDRRELGLSENDAIICKSCIAGASKLDPLAIAKQEIRAGCFESLARPVIKLWSLKAWRNSVEDKDAIRLRRSVPGQNATDPQSFDGALQDQGIKSTTTSPSTASKAASSTTTRAASAASSSSASDADDDYLDFDYQRTRRAQSWTLSESEEEGEQGLLHPRSRSSSTQSYTLSLYQGNGVAAVGTAEQQLWRQMRALQAVTESTYQMTLHTTGIHLKNRQPTCS